VDHALVNTIRKGWRLATPPVRPGAGRLAMFRAALDGASSAMVMGATVELIDMFLSAKVSRIAAFDGHAETLEALRGLGQEDWSRVELVVGDWRVARPEWNSVFDVVMTHGGLNFLPFPDDWRRALAAVRSHPRPGGRFVSSTFTVAPTDASFRDDYEPAIARFEAERPRLDEAQLLRRFCELVSHCQGLTLVGAARGDGGLYADRVIEARRFIREDLHRRYPGATFAEPVDAMFGRTNPVGVDGLHIAALPSLEQVEAEMTRAGFDPTLLASEHRPPKHSFSFAATRPL
jgi:SAM-dependent methyltransferase